ncbi:MAG: hypothetical protein ACP5TX_00090 [Thermoplasmata archaeon]
MFNKLDRYSSSSLGLISGILIGIVAVSLYFIFLFNLGLFQFLPPVILAVIAGFLMFAHVVFKFPSTFTNFFSGIIIVLAALFIFIDFRNQTNSMNGQLLIAFSIVLTIISFFSTVFLMKATEIKILTEPQKELPKQKEIPLDIEKKQKNHPKPPMDRL